MNEIKNIVITGAAGQIAYQLLFSVASGALFGEKQPISLHLLEIPELAHSLEGIKMELEDCAFPLLREIKIGSDPSLIFKDATHVFLIGSKPRAAGMERAELLSENGKIFVAQGKALNVVANKNVKVLVVGNPCNTNCLIALQNAPELDKRNFFAMTRLDQNRAVYQLAKKSRREVSAVSHMTIWGNHSSTQVPDFDHAKIDKKPVREVIDDIKWLENEFVEIVQKRGSAVISARGKSSAASAAKAALDAMKSVCTPTEEGDWYSSGVWSQGNSYGIDSSLIYSFPCRTLENGVVEIVSGLTIDPFLMKRLILSEKELKEEKEVVWQMFFSK